MQSLLPLLTLSPRNVLVVDGGSGAFPAATCITDASQKVLDALGGHSDASTLTEIGAQAEALLLFGCV